MKLSVVMLLIISFVAIAVFGVFGMQISASNHNGGCIAATANGMKCPKQNNSIDFFVFHFDAFKSFSTAVFSAAAFLLLIVSLFVVGIISGIARKNQTSFKFNFERFLLKQRELFSPPSLWELARWFALHEKSPAIL